VKSIKKVKRIEMIFPMSLITPLKRDVKNPNPMVNNIRGIINTGTSNPNILGVLLYPTNRIQTIMIWIIKGTMAFPAAAMTSDFFEKLILRIIGPALTSEFEHATRPVEKNCQKAIPSKA
jgi:hypothetical protein